MKILLQLVRPQSSKKVTVLIVQQFCSLILNQLTNCVCCHLDNGGDTLYVDHADLKCSLYNYHYNKIQISQMAFSERQKRGYGALLVLVILLVGLHLSVAGAGYEFYKVDTNYNKYKNGVNYAKRDYVQLAAFWIIAAGLTFFFSIALLIGICGGHFTAKLRHILASFTLVLEFAIAVTVSIAASRVSNLRSDWSNALTLFPQIPQIPLIPFPKLPENSDLELYYKLLIADAVITFVLEVVYLVFLFFGTLEDVDHTLVVDVAGGQHPAVTPDYLK